VSAFTTQLQEHLPPIDTLNAVLKVKSGVSGTFTVTFGTTFPFESKYSFAFERGTVTILEKTVTVIKDGKTELKEFDDRGNGVPEEIVLWAQQLKKGAFAATQSPEEALQDLRTVSTDGP
jgi:hypothetical protein